MSASPNSFPPPRTQRQTTLQEHLKASKPGSNRPVKRSVPGVKRGIMPEEELLSRLDEQKAELRQRLAAIGCVSHLSPPLAVGLIDRLAD